MFTHGGPPPVQQPVTDVASLWTPATALFGALAGLAGALVLLVVFAGIYMAAGGNEDDAAMTVAGAVLQDIAFVVSAWKFGGRFGPLRLRDFGLRRTSVKRAVGVVVGLGIAYGVMLAVYSSLVNLKEDTVPQDLGADKNTLALIAFALIAVVMAPLIEEFFFRGFVYRAFANKAGVALGALGSSLFFGILHWDFATADRLLAVVPLTVFGIALALAYHFTGSLYTSIAMHATNNSLAVVAFSAGENSDFGIAFAASLWVAMMAVCLLGPRLTDPPGAGTRSFAPPPAGSAPPPVPAPLPPAPPEASGPPLRRWPAPQPSPPPAVPPGYTAPPFRSVPPPGHSSPSPDGPDVPRQPAP